jgi:hypothetical protein
VLSISYGIITHVSKDNVMEIPKNSNAIRHIYPKIIHRQKFKKSHHKVNTSRMKMQKAV